ncbi:protein yceI precursor [alpha proteobacterium U9-1i]|nr:protein yceI precursor [alpha proteobacterium U9-1i]
MRVLFTALAMLAVACATPQATQAQAQPAAQVQQFVLDPAHTQVAFSIERFGFNYVLGRFDTIAGSVSLDQANPERSSVTATIQTASVSSGNATRDEHLRAARWLDAAQFPTMEFRSTSVRQTGAQTAEVIGNLTLHGITAPVTLTVTLNQVGASPSNGAQAAGFSATGTLSRSAFGITTAANLIGDQVRITIEALGQAATTPAN